VRCAPDLKLVLWRFQGGGRVGDWLTGGVRGGATALPDGERRVARCRSAASLGPCEVAS
jgi:hypothetical protein